MTVKNNGKTNAQQVTHNIKVSRAVQLYHGFKGAATLKAIFSRIPETLYDELTARQLALIAEAINAAYQQGRNVEMIEMSSAYGLEEAD